MKPILISVTVYGTVGLFNPKEKNYVGFTVDINSQCLHIGLLPFKINLETRKPGTMEHFEIFNLGKKDWD